MLNYISIIFAYMHSWRLRLIMGLLLLASGAQAQLRFSLATDFDVQHNFSADQRYWGIGQTIRMEWQSHPGTGFYGWVCYYNYGKFKNELTAQAKDASTLPARIAYINRGRMRFTQLSLGVKQYLKGRFDAETGWSVYGLAGLGVLMGKVDNNWGTAAIDTTQYHVPVLKGESSFNRLTLDLGAGAELPMGGDLFLYAEAKTLVPITYFPSPYLLNSHYNPLSGILCLGIRVLF